MKTKNTFTLIGISVLVAAVFLFAACSGAFIDPGYDGIGGDYSTGSNDDSGSGGGGSGSGGSQVGGLPSFEGNFVASQQEATELVTGADQQIELAIAQALAQGTRQNNLSARAAVSQNGHYEYLGISVDYTVSGNTTSDTYPFNYSVAEIVTIDGTYGGYRIKGNYNLELVYTYESSTNYSIKYNYDCIYTVSYNGKGMKIITTGDMTMTSTPSSFIYNLHYAVYDNNNTRRYNYDYKYST